MGSGQFGFPDYTIGGGSIPPGAVIDYQAPNKPAPQVIIILAAVFDDTSTEGDFAQAQCILDRRAGQRIQLKRINSLLGDYLNRAEAGRLLLPDLRLAISQLPQTIQGRK